MPDKHDGITRRRGMEELEQKLINLQHSTRTALPIFGRLHNWLRMKSRWYYNWHLRSNATKTHKTIALIYLVASIFSFANFTLYYGVGKVLAASYTWDGGGSTNDWSDCANWTTDTCPTSADTVTFNSTSTKDSTVDALFDGVITSISINSGYTGTITLARSLNTTSTGATSFSQAAGTFTAANQTLDIDGTFALSAGTFTASSGSMLVGGDFNITGSPTFNHNSGAITFDGGTKALACNNITFNLVVFNATATKTIGSACTVPLGSNPTMPNSLTVNGTLSGSGTLNLTSTATTTFNSGATLTGFTGFINNGGTTISGATINFGSYTTVDLNSAFTLSSGSFTAPSGTMTIATGFTVSGAPTFNANGGTITFDGVSGTLSCNNVTFNLVTFNHTSSKTVNSNCSLPLGNNPASFPAVVLNGTLSGSGTLTTSGTFTLNAGAALSGFSGLNVSAITIAGATADLSGFTSFTSSSTLTVSSGSLTLPNGADLNGPFTISGGTFNAPSGTMTVAGTMTISGAPSFNANGGTITFDGTSAALSCNNVTFNLVTFNNASTKTVNSDCSLPLGDSPTIANAITLQGTLSGTGTLTTTTGSFIIGSTAVLSGFTGLVTNGAFMVSGATANINLGSYTTVDFNTTFSQSNGTFTAPSGNMSVASTFSLTGGTFHHNNGTITFDGSASSLSCNNVTFNRVIINSTSAKTVNSDCTLPLGDSPSTPAGLVLNGTLTGTGTMSFSTVSSATTTLNSGAVLSGFTGLSAYVLTVAGANLDLSSYSSFSTTSTLTLSSGALSLPNGADLNGPLTISGGTFTAPSGNMTVAGALTISGSPTFNHNNGTVTIDGGLAVSLSCNNVTFNLVAFNNTASKTVNSDCILPLGNNPTLGGTSGVTVNGTLSGSGTLQKNGTGTITLNAGASLSGFTGFVTGPEISGLTISGATVDFGNYNPVVINGGVTINSGSLKAPSAGMTIRNNFINNTASGAAFNANGGTVTFGNNGLGGGTITCNGVTFNRVVLAIGMTIASDCTIPLGHDPVTANSTTLNGTLTGSGTLTATTGTFTFNSTTARITGFSALTFGSDSTAANLTVTNGATADLSSYSSVVVRGNVTMTSGTLTAPSGIFQIGGNFTNTGGTFNHNNGTVEFISRTANATNLINAGNVTFANLSATASSTNNSIIFQSGTTVTILKDLTIQGVDSSKKITIRTSTTGQTATIDPQGNRTIRHASVLDMINSNATPIAAGNGTVTNSGNNTGWNFFTPTVTSLGPTSATNGSKLTTNLPAFTFTLADSDTNDTVAYQIQIDNNSDFSSPTIDATSASMQPAATTYTTTKALADGSYYWRVRAIDTAQQTSEWATANADKVAFTIGTSITETPTESSGVTSATAESSDVDNPTQRFTVVIRLLDANKQPIVGAKVTLRSEPKETISDSEGYARFEDVELGEHTLTVEHNGQVGEQKIAITEDTVADLDPDKEGTISITVELKNVEAAPAQSRMIYALYGVTGALALIFIAMLIMLRRRTQRIVPKY